MYRSLVSAAFEGSHSYPYTLTLLEPSATWLGSFAYNEFTQFSLVECMDFVRDSVSQAPYEAWPINLSGLRGRDTMADATSVGGLRLDEDLLLWATGSYTRDDVTEIGARACNAVREVGSLRSTSSDGSTSNSFARSQDDRLLQLAGLSSSSVGGGTVSTSGGGAPSGRSFLAQPAPSGGTVAVTPPTFGGGGGGTVPVPEIDALSGLAALALLGAATALMRERLRR